MDKYSLSYCTCKINWSFSDESLEIVFFLCSDDFSLVGLSGHVNLGLIRSSGLLELGFDFLPSFSGSLSLGNDTSSSESEFGLILQKVPKHLIMANTAECRKSERILKFCFLRTGFEVRRRSRSSRRPCTCQRSAWWFQLAMGWAYSGELTQQPAISN